MNKRSKVVILVALLAVVSVLTSPPTPTWASFCPGAFCSSASQCASNCPTATSVACVNHQCQYNFGPGGPGGGSGCPIQSFCQDDDHCDFDFVQGTCVGGVCVC